MLRCIHVKDFYNLWCVAARLVRPPNISGVLWHSPLVIIGHWRSVRPCRAIFSHRARPNRNYSRNRFADRYLRLFNGSATAPVRLMRRQFKRRVKLFPTASCRAEFRSSVLPGRPPLVIVAGTSSTRDEPPAFVSSDRLGWTVPARFSLATLPSLWALTWCGVVFGIQGKGGDEFNQECWFR